MKIAHIVVNDGGDYRSRPTVTLTGAATKEGDEKGHKKADAKADDKHAAHGKAAAKGKAAKGAKADADTPHLGSAEAENVNPVEPHEETTLDLAAHGHGPGMEITPTVTDPGADAEAFLVGRKVVKVELVAARGKDFDGTPEVVFDPPGAKAVCVMHPDE